MRHRCVLVMVGCAVLFVSLAPSAAAQKLTVTGRVEVEHSTRPQRKQHESGTVVWLTPLDEENSVSSQPDTAHPKLIQKGKTFDPRLLVIPAGTVVDFPNRDPFFHNVFSLFEGKRFDLGLYEAGSTRSVHFNRPGVSYIFCNIHPEMSAVVIALATPYYAITTPGSSFTIQNVKPGRYQMQVWNESTSSGVLKSLTRTVTVSSDSNTLPVLRVPEDAPLHPHKNKYGHDYDPASGSPYESQP